MIKTTDIIIVTQIPTASMYPSMSPLHNLITHSPRIQ